MPFHRALAFLPAIWGCLVFLGNEAGAQNWSEYRNERYGFSLQYPADVLVLERAAEAGDGQVFVAADGRARLLVGALANEAGYTPATYQDYIARRSYAGYKVDYRRLAATWFVLSGEGSGKIFYEKVMFTCGGRLINSFAMIYPAAQRHVFDPVVERIEDTFRPAQECERAGFAPLPPRPRGAGLFHYPGPFYGERPALADRIALRRGHDVFIILRRTSPPYGREFVRGYASRR